MKRNSETFRGPNSNKAGRTPGINGEIGRQRVGTNPSRLRSWVTTSRGEVTSSVQVGCVQKKNPLTWANRKSNSLQKEATLISRLHAHKGQGPKKTCCLPEQRYTGPKPSPRGGEKRICSWAAVYPRPVRRRDGKKSSKGGTLEPPN